MQLRDSTIHLNNNHENMSPQKRLGDTLMQPHILDIQNGRQSAIFNFLTNLILLILSYIKI